MKTPLPTASGRKARLARASRLLHRLVDDYGYYNHHMVARADTETLTDWDIRFIDQLAKDYGVTDTQTTKQH